jgi:hypothetical protein
MLQPHLTVLAQRARLASRPNSLLQIALNSVTPFVATVVQGMFQEMVLAAQSTTPSVSMVRSLSLSLQVQPQTAAAVHALNVHQARIYLRIARAVLTAFAPL